MASEETIARATIQLGVDGSKLAPEMAAAVAKAQGELEKANRKMERAQATTFKAIQGHIDRINAARPTHEMRMLEQAVLKLGGTANLTQGQLGRVTLEVNKLAAAGAKVPASLSGLTGVGSKLGAVFQSLGTGGGISGALAAIGPAGLAASAGLGVVTLAGTKAFRAIRDLAAEAEQWTNLAESTGLGVVQVQQLSTLLEDAGIPAESLSTAFKTMQKEIAGGGSALAEFGVRVSDLKDLSPEEQFRTLAERIAAIEDPAVRTAAAIAAFGRSGQELIPVLDDVAKGADKMFGALSADQIASLNRADDVLDSFGRRVEFLGKAFAATAVEMAEFFAVALTAPRSLPELVFGTAPPVAKAQQQRQRQLFEPPKLNVPTGPTKAEEERDKQRIARRAKAETVAKKRSDELLTLERKRIEAAKAIVSHRGAEADELRALSDMSEQLLADFQKIPKVDFLREQRLRGGDMLPSIGGSGLFTRHQDVLDQELENAGRRAKEEAEADLAAERAAKMGTVFAGLSNGLALLGGALGGLWDRVLQVIQNIGQSFQGFKQKTGTEKFQTIAGAAGQLGSLVGGPAGSAISGAAGGALTGAAIGSIIPGIGTVAGAVVGGVIGGVSGWLSGNKAKKDAKEAGKILGRNVSEEAAKQLRQEAKAAGMSFSEFVKKIARDEARQKATEERRKVESGLSTAASGAQGLQALLEKGGLSAGLTSAFQALIGKVNEALLKTGLGILDARLAKSEKFTEAQGAAGNVAQIVAGMREAGFIDAGLTAAAGEAATGIRDQAIQAALESGLTQQEAQRAGSAAIASLLREQLNASVQSGNELDANTRALLEEAKRNGIEILADPAIESLAVQKDQLGVLRQIAGVRFDGRLDGLRSGDGNAPAAIGPTIDFELEEERRRRGDHIPEFAGGGLIRAPATGGVLTARFHGNEMVVPEDAFRMATMPGALRMAAPVSPGALGGGGGRSITVNYAPQLSVNVEGSADERTVNAALERLKGDLRKRDPEIVTLVAQAVENAV